MSMIGHALSFTRAVAQAERLAASRIPILLVGETGTGKELLAHHIHGCSGRLGEFVDIDCGAVPKDIVESLLFGHRRGAFTGAVEDTPGLVTQAHGGTLFLDEVMSLPLEGQAKLLRVLETREVRRVGETAKRAVDFRVIAAAQENCAERVEQGLFRRDLYHRIAGACIVLPPLRERLEDIAELAQHFAAAHQRVLGADAVALLSGYQWPGNVRELRVVVERAAVFSEDRMLTSTAIAESMDQHPKAVVDVPMRTQFLEACAANGWDPVRIARALTISRATLYRRLQAYGIRLREISKSHEVSSCLETS